MTQHHAVFRVDLESADEDLPQLQGSLPRGIHPELQDPAEESGHNDKDKRRDSTAGEAWEQRPSEQGTSLDAAQTSTENEEILSSISPGDGGTVEGAEKGAVEVPEEDDRLEPFLESTSILAHLAVFAILGVCIRYGLEVLWGPACLHVTDDAQALFMDVPPNMFGSFLMGIVGFVSKKHIAAYSQPLAIGLSTGLCGSITTFASWNQRMMSILAYGYVARALSGYILGTAVAYYSFLVGIDAAHALHRIAQTYNQKRQEEGKAEWRPKPEHYSRRWISLIVAVCLWIVFWIGACVAFALESTPPRLRKAALGCIVGPLGCWLRWYLSGFNGQGVGKEHRWKWVSWGTLSANLGAASVEAAVSAIDANNNNMTGSLIVGGLQIGFIGCLSTVSTLMQEVHVLVTAKDNKWRGHVYIYLITIVPSIALGILLYCVPVWVLGVASNGYNKVDPWDEAYVGRVLT